MKCLYVTWDAPHAAYLQSLFLPILSKLREFEFEFEILQFTWATSRKTDAIKEDCTRDGIRYRRVHVNRGLGGLGSFLSVINGSRLIRKRVFEGRFGAVVARSTMPALATLLAARRQPFPFVFDADGLPLDERIEFANRDPSSITHRFLRDIEYQMLLRSQSVLVRTQAARDIVIARAGAGANPEKFHVVTNGRDPILFKPASREERERTRATLRVDPEALLLVYAGSIGPQYRLDDMLEVMSRLAGKRTDARLLILTNAPGAATALITEKYPSLLPRLILRSASPHEVPELLAAADVAVGFRQPSFSMQAVAPIKLGEYLLSGLPIIGTPGIGDVEEAIHAGVYFPMEDSVPEAFDRAAEWCLTSKREREQLSAKARDIGVERFSLDPAVESYRRALQALTMDQKHSHSPNRGEVQKP